MKTKTATSVMRLGLLMRCGAIALTLRETVMAAAEARHGKSSAFRLRTNLELAPSTNPVTISAMFD